jgi:hypothetical protein
MSPILGRATIKWQMISKQLVTCANETIYTQITHHKSQDEEPRPPSQHSSNSQLPSPDYSASRSEDDDDDDDSNVAGQQPQPSQWTLPPKLRRRVAQTFIGAPNGKSIEDNHNARVHST